MSALLGAYLGHKMAQHINQEVSRHNENQRIVDAYRAEQPLVAQGAIPTISQDQYIVAQQGLLKSQKDFGKWFQQHQAEQSRQQAAQSMGGPQQQPNTVASQPTPVPTGSPSASAPALPPPPTTGTAPNLQAPSGSVAAPAAPAPPPADIADLLQPVSLANPQRQDQFSPAGIPIPYRPTFEETTKRNADIALTKLQQAYRLAPLQVGTEVAKAKAAGIWDNLNEVQKAEYLNGRVVPQITLHNAAPGDVVFAEGNTPKVVGYGGPKPVTTQAGAVTNLIYPDGKLPEGAKQAEPIAAPPPLLAPEDRAAKAAWIATHPNEQWSDDKLIDARYAWNQGTNPQATMEQQNAIVRSFAAKIGKTLDPSKPLLPQLPAGVQDMAVQQIKKYEQNPTLESLRQIQMDIDRVRLEQLRTAGGQGGGTGTGAGGGNSTAEWYADQIRRGLMTLKDVPAANGMRNSVSQVFAKSSEQPPVPLGPQFQTVVSQVDPLLKSIADVKSMLEPVKDNKTPGYYLPQRLEYAAGIGGEDARMIADLSYDSLRSAATLIRGQSRAYSVLQKALEHTPNVWKDSPYLIYEKLTEMEKQLREGKAAAIADGARSGVIQAPAMTPPPGTSQAPKVVQWTRDKNGNPVPVQ